MDCFVPCEEWSRLSQEIVTLHAVRLGQLCVSFTWESNINITGFKDLIQSLWRKKSWFIVSLEMLKGQLPKLLLNYQR